MRRPFPRLDKSRPYGTVTPPYEGACFAQNGYHFDNDGNVVEDLLDDKQRERHFGEGVADDRTLKGSAKFDEASYEIIEGLANVEVGALVAQAHDVSGLTVDEWNALTDDERGEHMERALQAARLLVRPAAQKKTVTQTIGAKSDKPAAKPAPAKVDPEERFEPIAPPPAAPPPPPEAGVRSGEVDPAKIDLKAWYEGRDKTSYASQELIAAVATQHGVKIRGGLKAVRSHLEEKFGPAK